MIALLGLIALAGIVAKGLGIIAIIFGAGVVVGIVLTATVTRRLRGGRRRS